jgi:hypothetical protein
MMRIVLLNAKHNKQNTTFGTAKTQRSRRKAGVLRCLDMIQVSFALFATSR